MRAFGVLLTLLLGCSFLSGCAPRARRIVAPRSDAGARSSPEEQRAAPVREASSASPAAGQGLSPSVSGEGDSPSGSTDGPVVLFGAPPLEQLAPFYEALNRLASGTRAAPVRIYWLGDSHTAADFMTHPIRRRLEGLVRPGGPGFVRLGLDGYRHGAVSIENRGRFRKAPILPAQRTRVLDGVFGYGGIRTLPSAGASSRLSYRVPEGLPSDAPMRWTISARLPSGASVWVRLGDQEQIVSASDQSVDGHVRATIEGLASDSLTVAHRSGSPELFGAFGELVTPGVVLDTVGINGARAATPLAWEPEQHVQSVDARSPDLLVLAYGSNEVFDRTSPERYSAHVSALVRRVRTGRPGLPCWVIGPPDAARDGGASRTRVAEVTEAQRQAAQEEGCAFTSAAELMGGDGAFGRWMAHRPAWARSDHVHLTIAGYEQLGERLADVLLGSSRAESEQPPPSAALPLAPAR